MGLFSHKEETYEAPAHLLGPGICVGHVCDMDMPGTCQNTYGTRHIACPFTFFNLTHLGHIKETHLDRWWTHLCAFYFLLWFVSYSLRPNLFLHLSILKCPPILVYCEKSKKKSCQFPKLSLPNGHRYF